MKRYERPALYSLCATALALGSLPAGAQEFDISGYFEPEIRYFFEDASSPDQNAGNFSLSGEVTLEWIWDRGDQSIVVTPFARWDLQDDNRTHADIRELRYERVFDTFEFRIGVDKVFWGVTEFAHIIDVINQTDAIENIDGEEKLGQPMVNVTVPTSLGTFDFFALPYFRERTFEDRDGRPRFNLRVDTDLTAYEDSDEEKHLDFAARWSHYFGPVDIGIAHFSGTGRDPILSFALNSVGEFVLAPTYVQIDQTSIDVQATLGSWLYKLEGFTRDELGDRYIQASGGFEYTFYSIFETPADLGIVGEFIYDERGKGGPNPLDREAVIGFRWAANDVQSTAILTGAFMDIDNEAWGVAIEAERRIGSDLFLTLEARLFEDVPVIDPFFSFEDEDFVQLRLARYF